MLQQQVNKQQPLGNVGALYDTSPRRITGYAITGDADKLAVARVAVHAGDGKVTVGGGAMARYAGVILNSRALPRPGLDASLAITPGTQVEVADMGRIVIPVTKDAAAQNGVIYNVLTGVISPHAGGALPADHEQIANAVIHIGALAGGLAVIQLR